MDYDLAFSTASGFIEVTFRPRTALWVRGGLRADRHSVYSRWTVHPRINLTWIFRPNWRFKLGWGRFSQALSSSVEYGFYSIASIYFPTEGPIPTAIHTLVGLIYDNTRGMILDLAWYHKEFNHLLYVLKDGSLRTGPGISNGLEFLLSYAPRPGTSAQLAYAYTVVQKIQMGETFYPNYDQRHKLHCMLTIPFWRGRELNLTWSLGTGRPANLARIVFYGEDAWPFLLSMPKNVFRYPVFHRLDLSIMKTRNFRKGQLITYLQIMNLYARRNVVYYKDIERKEIKIKPAEPPLPAEWKEVWEAISFNGFPFLPTIGCSYEF